MQLIAKLKKLSATQFEHLIYDLLVLSGLRNGVWRTPGPDAGRDIEGQVITVDMSENMTVERWYVECKRYNKSVDWPTVYQKISYAHNHGADFLMLATTATLSPRCKEEISRREVSKERPFVRVWDGPVLELMVARQPFVLVKYGLTKESRDVSESILPLVTTVSKVVQAAYGKSAFADAIDPALEFSAAIVELMSARLAEISAPGRGSARRFVRERDLYSWCEVAKDVDLAPCDSYGLRALLTAVRFYSGLSRIVVSHNATGRLTIRFDSEQQSKTMLDVLSVLSLWSNLEVRAETETIVLSLKQEDNHG